MGLLDAFWPAPYDDPSLGELRRRGGRWRGQIVLEEGGEDGVPVPLAVAGGWSSPDAGRLQLARELAARYDGLRPVIARAMFEHYQVYAEALAAGEIPAAEVDDAPRILGSGEVWDHVALVRISIERLGGVDTVELAYQAAWDQEHTLGARLQGWELAELNGSVL